MSCAAPSSSAARRGLVSLGWGRGGAALAVGAILAGVCAVVLGVAWLGSVPAADWDVDSGDVAVGGSKLTPVPIAVLYPVLDSGTVRITRFAISASGSLSIVGTLAVLVLHLVMFRVREIPFHLRMVMYLAVADLLAAVAAVFGANLHTGLLEVSRESSTGEEWCVASGAAVQFCLLCSVLLTACIGHMLDAVVRRRDEGVERLEGWYLAVALFIPAGLTTYLVLTHRMGDAGLWCWIHSNGRDMGALLRLLCFYAWVFGVMVFLAIVSVRVHRKLRRDWEGARRALEAERTSSSVERTLGLISLALILLWIPGLSNRIQNFVQPGRPIPALYIAHAIATPLQGFVNSIIIGMNEELRYHIKLFLWQHWRCCNPDTTYLSVQEEEDALIGRIAQEYDYESAVEG